MLAKSGQIWYDKRWKGGRVVDGTGLENQQVNSFAGSNPVPSARDANAKLALCTDL